MSKKLNHSSAIGIFLIGILISSISEGFSQTTNYFTWNNSTNLWSTASAWSPTGGPQSSSSTANTNVAIFAATGAGNNTALLGSDRTVYGLIFTNGANAYTLGSVATAKQLDIMNNIGLQNVSGQNQIFNLSVANNGTGGVWNNSAGSTTTFNNGLNLTTAGSTASRTLTLSGAGTWNVASTIANGGTATAGAVTVTATGTTILSGNNTYDGLTTMNAAGGTLTLSGNNSGAAGGVTLTTGTLNLNNANALGTGLLTLGATTGSSIGSSIINNTSGGALTYLGLSGVVWSGVTPAAIQFGTGASTSANNMDFGSGLVTATTSRAMNIAGTGVTVSMGTLNVTGVSNGYTFTFDGSGNTIDLDGWKIGAAASPTQNVVHQIKGSANVTLGLIENGTAGFVNGAEFNSDGVTRLTGNNTYTGTTTYLNGTNIVSGNNSAAVGNVSIGGTSGSSKTPVVRLNNVNAISSASGISGSSSSATGGTMDFNAATAYTLNSYNGGNMIFTNSFGQASVVTFTNASSLLTSSAGSSGGRSLQNNSSNLKIVFDGNLDIGSSQTDTVNTMGGVGDFVVKGNIFSTTVGSVRGLSKTGAGLLEMRGANNSYNGDTTIWNGTLSVTNGALLSGSTVKLNSGTLNVDGTVGAVVQTNGTYNLRGTAGALTLSGGAATVFSGGTLGNTTVTNTGSLLVVNGTAGNVQVDNGGSLGGSGTVGAVTLASGSFLKPGNSPGLLTAASSSWAAGATYNWEIDQASGGTAGVNWDLFSVTGNLDLSALSSTAQMNLVLNSLPSMDDYTTTDQYSWVFAEAGSLLGTGGTALTAGTNVTDLFNITAAGFNGGTGPANGWKVEVGSTGTTLNLMAIPEPSSASMLGLGLAGLVITRLVRRKSS